MGRRQPMSKLELKRLIADRMRDPAISGRDFLSLAKRYESLCIKPKKQAKPPRDTVNEAVLKIERERASAPKQPAIINAPQGVTPADAKAYLASGQTGMPQDALKEQMEAEWRAELEGRRKAPANRADVNE